MSRIKVSKTASTNEKQKSREWPVVVYFWIIGLALISYIIARFVLNGYSHPYHWGIGLAGGVLGVGIGWLWYRWRGDVF
jgi:CHASE2 domain-containing sensor protein